jgi:5-methyltetrahydrofolate--homocysteine methyltransferase
VFDNIDLNILKEHIDWTPFFTSWQLRGKFPQILKDTVVGKEATDLYNDALKMLEDIIDGDWLRSKGVIGIFPANSNEDDIEIYNDENRSSANVILHQLRQQLKKAEGKSNYCLADFIAPKNSNIKDHIGAFAVTTGLGIEQKLAEFEKDNDDYQSILLKALADRLAEAAAEYLHLKIRKDIWGYSSNESLDNNELINEKYIGIRPAPGYPSCPDHTEKLTIFNDLLNVEKHTGITLTESMAMYPASSVCGLYFAHPESRYFGLGLIKKDQVSDYAKRKNKSVDEINKWLSPNLSTE